MTEPAKREHRLAAVLVADVVGYSRMVERDEAGTLARMRKLRSDVLQPVVESHAGRIVKLMGDGVLVEFSSAVDAVRAALALHRGFAEADESASEDDRIRLRIGINLGEVTGEGDDILGSGVNIAARIEALAEPGGTAISAKVMDEVRGRVELDATDAGEQTLKNISRPVRVFHIRPKASHASFAPDAGLALPDKPSVAVLPFANLSPDAANEFLADGISEDVLTALSRIGELFVVSRNSSFVYKGKAHRIETVARELGVRYVLEGSVRAAGNRVRITAQLIDGQQGNHIWAERFDGDLTDVFELQDQITHKIALALNVQLAYGELAHLWDGQTANLRAWELMAQARNLFLRFNESDNLRARGLLEQALGLDPAYTGAMVLLGLSHWVDARFRLTADRAASLSQSDALADRALGINPGMGSALMLKGGIDFLSGRHDAAVAQCRRAAEAAPSDSWARAFYGLVCNYSDQPAEGRAAFKLAMRLSPYPPAWYTYGLALAELWCGDLAEAEAASRKNVQQEPDDPYSYINLVTVLAFQGRKPEARAVMSTMLNKFPHFTLAHILRSEVYKDSAKLERVIGALVEAGLPG